MMRIDVALIEAMGGSDIPAAYISDGDSLCLIAELDEVPVGYACCTADATSRQVLDIFVAKLFRGRGIGSCIVKTLKLWTPSDHSVEAYIDVRDKASLNFFKRNNFKAVGMLGELVIMRFGWRFRKSPKSLFRGIKK
jgi:GNAT superfamily N-acetyltransferase